MEILAPFFLWFKALHIMAVISWMAGLFYLPRLFVHHAERAPIPSDSSEIFKNMERKLYFVIMRPAMIASWIFGLLMVFSGLINVVSIWFLTKFICAMLMTGFHFWCGSRVRDFQNDTNTLRGRQFRIANEIPTVLMIIIVIMVVIQPFG